MAHHESIAKKNVWKSVKDKYVKNQLPKVTVYWKMILVFLLNIIDKIHLSGKNG